MKSFFRFIIGKLLAFKARYFLKKHRVQVIGVTGSMGKTSTKEAIYHVLKNHFDVYSSQKSFNTEIGLSLAVLQEEESGFSSFRAWFKILRRVLFQKKKAYRKIVLEMGADKPGDLKKLIRIAHPTISVVTNVNPVHMAEGQFKNLEDIAKEKSTLVRLLPKSGVAVLNADDPYVREMTTLGSKFFYSAQSEADLQAEHVSASGKHLSFTVTYKSEHLLSGKETEKFVVPVIGMFQIYVLLPAISVALQLGMTLKDCAEALKDFSLPPGRMNPIAGLNGAQIIDSSYNASPKATESALELLSQLKATRRIAALGTMNELGEQTYEAHIAMGKKASEAADLLVAVGKEAPTIKKGAMEAGMEEDKIFTFFDSEEAGASLKDKMQSGDLILVKGSQNQVRMERLVKVIMKEPHRAEKLLCRQGEAWERI